MQSVSLYELNNLVSQLIEQGLPDEVWVTGELAEGRAGSGGHFYGELVQKDARGVNIIARARITIWARNYNMIRLRFAHETGSELRAGMKVQLLVRVSFHEQYGYSLNVLDVDSTYTIGDMARRRQEILRQLEDDGVIDDNRTLPLPALLQRIAVVSSDKAAGYGDFCDQLLNNEYGLGFHIRLFPAIMQGARVEESVMSALTAIADEANRWDAVVIIRGGGAVTDLSDFDSYLLAAAVAQFPLPVLVGIGHERDETVLDYVAHTRLKTPTAVAAFIIEHQAAELAALDGMMNTITAAARQRLVQERHAIQHLSTTIPMAFANTMQRQRHRQELISQRIRTSWRAMKEGEEHRMERAQQRLRTTWLTCRERETHRHELLAQRLKSLDPDILLKRGYTITLVGGKIVTNIDDLHEGDVLTTRFESGELLSKVLCKNK